MITLEPLPPRDAIAFWRSKGLAPQLNRFDYRDHWREDHARDFVVAKAMRDDVLETIRAQFDRSLSEGRTLAQFQADLKPELVKAGWWGRALMDDPLTGETQEVQLGSMRRLRTIFDTNMRTAHAAGHWARIERTKKAFPYLHYIQIERPSKRHDHERYHDKIWRVDDPIWRRIYPPNGYFCGCTVIQRTEGWMKRNGRSVSDPIDLEEQPWTNKRTGEEQLVPKGIHPGFDSNPGAAWLDIRDRVAEVMPGADPEDRARIGGIVQAMRLRQTSLGRESLVVTDAPDRVVLKDADPETPDRVSVDAALTELGAGRADLLHSHQTETPLSLQDLRVLGNPRAGSILAVSPGGSNWRARPGKELLGAHPPAFAHRAIGLLAAEAPDLDQVDRDHVSLHAFALYLERRGVIRYDFSITGRMRDLFARFASLIERLSS
ncbi:F protein [Citreicella sp. 357]|nr:F protein [Citreicella sp. 357]